MAINNPEYHSVIGNNKAIELSKKRTWDKQNGIRTYRRFVGAKPAIEAKFNELSNAGTSAGVDELDEDISGYSGQLVARVYEDSGGALGGNTEEINAIWELYGQDILKPIETHKNFDGIKGERKYQILYAIAHDQTITPALSGTAEEALAGYLSHQVLDYMLGEYILRKSTTVSSKSIITASHTNVYRVVSLSSINPPSVLLGVLSSLQKENGSTGAWEWLKKPPQIIQVSRTKFQLRYEWIGVERWAQIYGGKWTPSYDSTNQEGEE